MNIESTLTTHYRKALWVAVLLSVFGSQVIFPQSNSGPIQKEFSVSGSIKGLDVNEVFIDYTNEKGDRVWDTVAVKNHSFKYMGKTTTTKKIQLWPFLAKMKPEDYRKQKPLAVQFFVRPGDHIVFNGSTSGFDFNAVPTGNTLNENYQDYLKSVVPLDQEMEQAIQELANKDKTTLQSSKKIQAVKDKYTGAKASYIMANPKSEISAYLLIDIITHKSLGDRDLKSLFSTLDSSLSSSPFYLQAKTRLEGDDATKPGNIVPELVTKSTIDGEEFDLRSLRGKYVLLDFWGTWCGPCVKEMPQVKEYDQKYRGQLVVVGINSGDKRQKIIDFITPKKYDWVQLLSEKGGGDNDFVSKFNISGFPTKFIIDPKGEILFRYVGNAEESFKKLDEIFTK